jgi:hypothetical protein
LLGIGVLEHIIVGRDSYFSFADEGLMGSEDPPPPAGRRRE